MSAPTPADPSRKRAATGPEAGSSKSKSKKVNVSPKTRVLEYPNSGLCVDGSNLFCDYCHKVISVKASTIDSHLQSELHKNNTASQQSAILKSQTIARAFETFKVTSTSKLPSDSTLSGDHVAFRAEVLRVFLKSGTPLHRLPEFRVILEKGGYSLTSESHLCKRLFKEMDDRKLKCIQLSRVDPFPVGSGEE